MHLVCIVHALSSQMRYRVLPRRRRRYSRARAPSTPTITEPSNVVGPLPKSSAHPHPPSRAPSTPMPMTPSKPPGVRPGVSALANPPASNPTRIQPNKSPMPIIFTLSGHALDSADPFFGTARDVRRRAVARARRGSTSYWPTTLHDHVAQTDTPHTVHV